MATRTTAEPNDWETVEPNDWETVPATQSSSPSLSVDFSNKSGQGTYPMWDTAGKKHDVPYGEVQKAQGIGYKFDTNKMPTRGGLDPETAFLRDRAADPQGGVSGKSFKMSSGMTPEESSSRANQIESNAPLPIRIAGGVAKGAGTLAKPVLDVMALGTGQTPQDIDEMLTPRSTAEKVAKYGTIAAPIVASGVAAPVATALGIGGGILGTMGFKYGAEKLGATPQQAEVVGDIGGFAGGMGGGKVGSIIDRNVAPWTAGYKSTHGPSQAHEAVIADAGGDIIPRDAARTTTKMVRNQAAAMPGHVKTIMEGDPQSAYAAHLDILNNAKKSIDNIHEVALKPVENMPIETESIIHKSVPTDSEIKMMPDSGITATRSLIERIHRADNMRDLNTLRIQLNDEDKSLKSGEFEPPSPGYGKILHKAANSVRDAYYDQLEAKTGKDFSGIKRDEGQLVEELRMAEKSQAKFAHGETKAKTKLGRETTADLVSGVGHGGARGLPIVSSAADAIRGTELARVQSHLKTMYADLEPHTPVSVSGGLPPSKGLLPENASPPSGQKALPSSVIPNADEFGTSDNGTVPNQSSGFHVKPEESAYPHEQVIPGKTPPATGPTVPEKPVQYPQLGEGEPGKVGSKSVEQVGARPASPNQPPPVNPSTAVERVTPKQGSTISLPNAGSFRVIEARPNGEMVILQTRQLPAPEARAGLPAQASPSTVTPSTPQLPPVGYKFTGPDGIVREVTKVSKLGTVTLKEVKGPAKVIGPKSKELQAIRNQSSQ